jgi:hypothetical protein
MPISSSRFSLPLTLLLLAGAHGAVYHVSPEGNDAADGRSPATAWKSLARAEAAPLEPGDSLLFARGGAWKGRLHVKASGTPAAPIAISAYGTGTKPILDGDGLTGTGVLWLDKASWLDVSGIEITDNAPAAGDRRGVMVQGPARGVRLAGLKVRDVKGRPGQELADKATGGIHFTGGGSDFAVEGCEIANVDDIGLTTNAGAYARFAVRDNVIHEVGKNAIIFRGCDSSCVVERNVCFRNCARVEDGNTIFSVECSGTRFQFNEGFANLSSTGRDGSLYDADINGASGTVWQYSYSHGNAEGLMWFCTNAQDTGIKVRYNISRGDLGKIFCFSFPLGHADIYNNTVDIGPQAKGWILYEKQNRYGYGFYNNIIFNASASTAYVFANASRAFEANLFYGAHPAGEPADARKSIGDPRFAAPASVGDGLAGLGGYQLLPGSPALNSGRIMPGNGGRDFFGNPLYTGAPDRGAYEAPDGSGVRTPDPSGRGRLPGRGEKPGRFHPGQAPARDALGRLAYDDADPAGGEARLAAERSVFRALGLLADASAQAWIAAWRAENRRRAEALASGRTVIGPARFSLSGYSAWRRASLALEAEQVLASRGLEPRESDLMRDYAVLRGSRFAAPYAVLTVHADPSGSRAVRCDTLDLPLKPRDGEGEDPQGLIEAARTLRPGERLRLAAARGYAAYRARAVEVACLSKGTRFLPYGQARPLLRRDRLRAALETAIDAALRPRGGYVKF